MEFYVWVLIYFIFFLYFFIYIRNEGFGYFNNPIKKLLYLEDYTRGNALIYLVDYIINTYFTAIDEKIIEIKDLNVTCPINYFLVDCDKRVVRGNLSITKCKCIMYKNIIQD